MTNEPSSPARLVAFYFPQFHPIEENSRWWGTDFTDWETTRLAKPLYPGHRQPVTPGELGCYNLLDPAVRERQAALAREYGIEGFCYWHYWFAGRRLLEKPFEQVLASGKPDFPFCLAWANDSWGRRHWFGHADDTLVEQTYSAEDDAAHIAWLIPALKDPRALRIDGKPVFVIYRPLDLPDPRATIALWRMKVAEAGLAGIYLIGLTTFLGEEERDLRPLGFDASVCAQPDDRFHLGKDYVLMRLLHRFPRLFAFGKRVKAVFVQPAAAPKRKSYADVVRRALRGKRLAWPHFRCVFPRWDNSPRKGNRGVVAEGATPEIYGQWLSAEIDRIREEPRDHRLIFIKSWNEWAEGNYLEPDAENGRAFLEATRRANGL